MPLHFDLAGQPISTDAEGRVKSPFDGINRKWEPDPDARADIVRVGRIYEREDGVMAFEGWEFECRFRNIAAVSFADPYCEVPARIGGYPVAELVAIAEELDEGASVPGRGESVQP